MAKTKPFLPIDLAKVEVLSANGMENDQIADALGISERTFYRRKKDMADMADAIKKGKAKGEARASSKLAKLIDEGNLGAICFFLKCKCGWSEKLKIESNNTTTTKIFLFDGDAPKGE